MDSVISFVVPLLLGAGAGVAGALALRNRSKRMVEPLSADLKPVILPVESSAAPGALVLVDVDRMAAMNAEHGPDVGDRVLERLGDVIRRALPAGTALERLDGGRFVLWLSQADADKATALAEELRQQTVRSTVEVGRERVGRTISAGVVLLDGDEGRARALMAADTALGRAKKLGGNRVALATAPVHASGPTAADVQEAIRTGAIGYHVQPVFSLKHGYAIGVEALLRWTRPDGRVMPPSDFLHRIDALPEDVAAIFADLAVEAARPFVEAPKPIRFGLNLTAGALDEEGSQSRDWLLSVLSRLPADQIVLELLESSVVTDPVAAAETLQQLRDMGVILALDDFGSGLSNLDRVLDISPQVIKMDKRFVSGLGENGRQEAVLARMVELTRDLDITIVSEGLETAADTEIVRALGVSFGQGYHLGRPHPVAYWVDKLIT